MSDNPASLVDLTPSQVERHVVARVTGADVPTISKAMTRAFFDDPVVGDWCLADESRRTRRLERIFELFLHRMYLPHDECYAAEGLVGGAFWLPPGTWKLGALAQLRLVARMSLFTGRATPRILQVLNFLEAKHPHEPHYYLQFLGVDPQWQSQGIGSALMQPILRRCDGDGVPAYLEASSERNRALYERHGFAVVEEVRLPGGGPPLWRMWREPCAP
jgi:ribosomal protein S18 acetylase RimI-like enzyme